MEGIISYDLAATLESVIKDSYYKERNMEAMSQETNNHSSETGINIVESCKMGS